MWLAIEGVVGAGKTTTSSTVAELVGAVGALERLDDHPFLEAYYRDPARYAVETELAFMLLHLRHVQESLPSEEHLVSDFAPAKNLVFARLEVTAEDLSLLEAMSTRLWSDLPSPDLTVFLDVPLETCHTRLVARGRHFERNLRVDDLARIRDGYLADLDSLGTVVRRLELSGRENPAEVAELVVEVAGLEREQHRTE